MTYKKYIPIQDIPFDSLKGRRKKTGMRNIVRILKYILSGIRKKNILRLISGTVRAVKALSIFIKSKTGFLVKNGEKFFKYRISKNLTGLDKRGRFIIQSLILSFCLWITQYFTGDAKFILVGAFSLLTYILTAWSLKEDIKGEEWFFLFIIPVLFTSSVFQFYFLLPERFISRISILIIYSVGMYSILLVENIFNVSLDRTIKLLRAGQSVGLFLILLTSYFYSSVIYALRLSFLQVLPVMLGFYFLLFMKIYWAGMFDLFNIREKIKYSLLSSFLVIEILFISLFLELDPSMFALLATTTTYSIYGYISHYLETRLFSVNIKEYFSVFTAVLAILIIQIFLKY